MSTYTKAFVRATVPPGFMDSGGIEDTIWIRDCPLLDVDVKRILARHFNCTEVSHWKLLKTERTRETPGNVLDFGTCFMVVLDNKGNHIEIEER